MPNRTICAVLSEMRKAIETLNFSYLAGLIEEVQTLANRMEAALWDQQDINRLRDEKNKLKNEVKQLKKDLGKSDETF